MFQQSHGILVKLQGGLQEIRLLSVHDQQYYIAL